MGCRVRVECETGAATLADVANRADTSNLAGTSHDQAAAELTSMKSAMSRSAPGWSGQVILAALPGVG